MTSKQSIQVKYELLEDNKRTAVKSSHLWTAVLLVILVVCSSVIAFWMTWMHLFYITDNDEIDFLVFGPTKSAKGIGWMSQQRGNAYGEALEYLRHGPPSNDIHLEVQQMPREEPTQYKLMCYYNLPSVGSFHILPPDMLSADLCTHIIIAFATVVNGTIQEMSSTDIEVYKAVTELKKVNPELKVLLSVQWFTSVGEFAWMVSSLENRTRFVDGAVRFLEDNRLDGLDIDWEFPSWPTEVENQTGFFTDLLALLSAKFRQRPRPLLLSVAAGAPKPIIDRSYNITLMAQYIDYVNVMSYDYHMYQSYLPLTGANSPLYHRHTELGYFTTLNVNWTALYWLEKGMPASKIIIGIPTYGHSFTLVNEDNHDWDAPSSGFGTWGSDGFVAYYEVCSFLQKGVKTVFDYESKVPYAYKNKEWISFDNEQSVAYKAELVRERKFGGAMVYSLNTDDVEGVCGGKMKFPLSQRVKNVLQDDQL